MLVRYQELDAKNTLSKNTLKILGHFPIPHLISIPLIKPVVFIATLDVTHGKRQ
jgi:hypothetical protein